MPAESIAAKAREEIEEELGATLDEPLRDFRHTVEAIRYFAPDAKTGES